MKIHGYHFGCSIPWRTVHIYGLSVYYNVAVNSQVPQPLHWLHVKLYPWCATRHGTTALQLGFEVPRSICGHVKVPYAHVQMGYLYIWYICFIDVYWLLYTVIVYSVVSINTLQCIYIYILWYVWYDIDIVYFIVSKQSNIITVWYDSSLEFHWHLVNFAKSPEAGHLLKRLKRLMAPCCGSQSKNAAQSLCSCTCRVKDEN